MADPDNIELTPHYYRDNFLRLCDTVEAQYADILTAQELSVLHRFRRLEFKAQCLYVRLLSRTGPWFRESKLSYAELGALDPILDSLIEQDMVLVADTLSIDELGKLYTAKELLQAFSSCLANRKFRDKPSLLAAIDELPPELTLTPQALDEHRIVTPRHVELLPLLQLLFFGNRHQSLTEFVLDELGVNKYYPYRLDREFRLFPHREALDEYLACAALGDHHHDLLDRGELDSLPTLASDILSMKINFATSKSRWYRLCNSVARDLERQQEGDIALQLYQRSERHPARERSARVLERHGDWAAAAAACKEILLSPWCESEREAAERILPRVQRKLDGRRVSRRRDTFAQMTLQLPQESGSVELLAAARLRAHWQCVHYVENKLMNALFGLAFWEQIFEAVPGVFHNPYQSVPTDMYQRAFRARREKSIAARLTQLRSTDLAGALADAYHRYQPFQCRWVDWRRIDSDLFNTALQIIPAAHLLAIWEQILFDPGENRRGFPDLVALGNHTGEYCLIEIKGPGDALQDSQKRWLRFFDAHQIPAKVAWVEWEHD